MSKVMTGATMSIDGYISGPNESGFDHLFRWYGNGDVETPTAMPGMTLRTSKASAEHLRELNERTGALVVGRHLYDATNGWGGRHPMDVPVVVLTHRPPTDRPVADENFVFVTEGIEAAVATARELAGDSWVVVNGGTIARQCLEAGLLDEIHVDLAPVLLGSGTPFFSELATVPVELVGPTRVVEGIGVTHLRYEVVR
ncbi:dihydrofolate reductase family protein [Plantactinospora sp. GCM10030261]|uniref:dihydrofolate reductase family protein n=1 Tax=Plantactinospora sp. GCM10030261 TaxID=3273420 RepID=UPI00361C42F6